MYFTERPNNREELIDTLDDGFERWGNEDTPYTLRAGEEKRREAEQIHQARASDQRQTDERSNEPLTRDLEKWEANLQQYDFPFIDAIQEEKQKERVHGALDIAKQQGLVEEIKWDIDFEKETIRGKFFSVRKKIEIGTNQADFPGFREGPVLAHEIGHAFAEGHDSLAGYESGQELFPTEEQEQGAKKISKRFHGPFQDVEEEGVSDYRLQEHELFAQVVAALIIETDAVFRIAPAAASRVEDLLSDRYGPVANLIIDL